MTRTKPNKKKGKKKRQRHLPYSSDRIGAERITRNDCLRLLRKAGVTGQVSNVFPAMHKHIEELVSKIVHHHRVLLRLTPSRKTIDRKYAQKAFELLGHRVVGMPEPRRVRSSASAGDEAA